jgi:dienelactone hydrolase
VVIALMRLPYALIVAALIAAAAPPAGAAAAPESVEIPVGETRLRAMLFKPEGSGRFPVVVGLHGCGGLINSAGAVQSRYRDWAQRLAADGFAVLYLDSYGSRGLSNQCTVSGSSRAIRSARERVADANAAKLWLQSQSWAIGDRISLLGWSNGGITTLSAVRPRASKVEGADFRSAVALYPGCRRLRETAWSARVPTLILIGRADDQAPAAACEQMVAGARGRSAHVAIRVYPGAYHDFDHPNRAVQVRSGYGFSVDGSGRVHTGTNPAARADALKRVAEWLKR